MCTHTKFYHTCGCYAYTEPRHLCEWLEQDGFKKHPIKTHRGWLNENCKEHPSTGTIFVDSKLLNDTGSEDGKQKEDGNDGVVVLNWNF